MAPLHELSATMRQFQVAAPLAQVLWSRGIHPDALEIRHVLSDCGGLWEAAEQLDRALRQNARIRIHGDYDADGVTAATTLLRGLKKYGARAHMFFPDRIEDGYGLKASRVEEHAQNCDLLVTVDCGVTGNAVVDELLALGTEVIVTDHHARGETLPNCVVVHPELSQNFDPQRHNLTGAGVAYHLVWALRALRGEGGASREHPEAAEPQWLAPIATIGTIADVARLTGENRALVTRGIEMFPSTELPGLQALKGEGSVTTRDVAFMLAPRLNAAGRLGRADVAAELLITDDPAEAADICARLEQINTERKLIQSQMAEQAMGVVNPNDRVLVVTHPEWHPGVMGIVASKLLETFHRPVFIVAKGKGSVRSVDGMPALEGLRRCADLLPSFGGHPMAAGFSIDPANVGELRRRLNEWAEEKGYEPQPGGVHSEAPLLSGDYDSLMNEMENLEPFGKGFEAPRWHLRGQAQDQRLIGQTRSTLSYRMYQLKGICYQHPEVHERGADFCVNLEVNVYREQVSLQWKSAGVRDVGTLDMNESGLPKGPRLEAAVTRISRCSAAQALELLKSGGEWYSTQPASRDFLLQRSLKELSEEGNGPLVIFEVPRSEQLAQWLRSERPLVFAFGERMLRESKQVYTEGFDHSRCEDQAEQYHRLQWGHAFECCSDRAFALQVLSAAGSFKKPVASDH